MMQLVAIAVIVWIRWIPLCNGANILALPISDGYSHFCVIHPLLIALAERGHNVTVVGVNTPPDQHPNYHHINLGHDLVPAKSKLPLDMVLEMGNNPFSNMATIWKVGESICELVLRSGVLNDLYHSDMRFDLVITHLWACECTTVFAHKFNTSIVSVVTSSALPWSNERVGNPNHPGHVINNFVNVGEAMTFPDRVLNTLAWLWSALLVDPLSYSRTDALVRRYLDEDAPPVRLVHHRTAVVLVNSHFSILQTRPLVPNFVEVGGIHVRDPKPLPEDLQSFLDGAVDGAVVFSLGSLVRASSMSNDTLGALLDAFATLPQRVVFKYELPIDHAPPNVMVRKWLPQRDILEHPHVRVLMAHGGQSSTIEAVHTGTPMVGLPLFSDQYSNIRTLVSRGAATSLDMRRLTKQAVLEALNPVLTDPSYKQNAMQLSREFRDRPLGPLETAVYWTEYVLRHGAAHMRGPATRLPWYQALLLDVIAVLLLSIAAICYTLKIVLRSIYRFNRKLKTD